MPVITEDVRLQRPAKTFCCSLNVLGKILFTTPAMTSFLLYRREDLESHPLTEVVHPQDRPIVTDKLSSLSLGAEHIEFSARFILGDGSYANLNWTIDPCGGMYTASATVSTD